MKVVQNWGSYVINVYNPTMISFTGLRAFQTLQTSGDNVDVTHLTVYGGWFGAAGDVFYLRNLASSRFQGMATRKNGGTNVNGFNVDTSFDTTFSPGEFENLDGYGFVFGSGCAYLWVDVDDLPVLPTAGLINETNYKPNRTRGPDSTGSGNEIRLFPSRSDQAYYARFSTRYYYP